MKADRYMNDLNKFNRRFEKAERFCFATQPVDAEVLK